MLDKNTWLYLALLVFPVSLIYLATSDSYFVADDFWQVHYSARIASGEIELFWRNFTSNYVQLPGANFYRPVLGLTYLCDYLVWKTNPFGYHLTNVLLYEANIVLLYLLVTKIVPQINSKSTSLIAFCTALLFASTPLHTEAVAWISGRADVLAGVFYLLSLYLFCLTRFRFKNWFYLFSLLAYILALGSKEISIGLPMVVFAISLFHYKEQSKNTDTANDTKESPPSINQRALKVFQKLKDSILLSLPFALIAGLYLLIRLYCFGTILGGYIGGFGASKSQFVLTRWIDPNIWLRLVFPFNVAISQDLGIVVVLLCLSLLLCALMILVNLIRNSPAYKTLAILSIWMASTLIPLFGVWGIDQYLHNSRLVFFFTMPLAAVLPVLLLNYKPRRRKVSKTETKFKFGTIQAVLSVIGLFSLSTIYFYLTVRVDGLWLEAGRIVKGLKGEATRLARGLEGNSKSIILGIPGDFFGAFVILNGSTFHHMMSPPLSDSDYSRHLVTFKPFIFGHENYVNSARLKALTSSAQVDSIYRFDIPTKKLRAIQLKPIDKKVEELKLPFVTGVAKQKSKLSIIGKHKILPNNTIVLGNSPRRPRLQIDKIHINPLDYDFIRFMVKSKEDPKNPRTLTPVMVTWNKNRNNKIVGAVPSNLKTLQPTVIGLSQYWKWYQSEDVTDLNIIFGKAKEIHVSDLSLLNSKDVIPSLSIKGIEPLNSGEYVLSKSNLVIEWDASSIEKANSVLIEISKPNYFLEGPTLKSSILHAKPSFDLVGTNELTSKLFQEGSYTQIRILALDGKGRPVSQYSDPVTVFMNKSKTKNSYIY